MEILKNSFEKDGGSRMKVDNQFSFRQLQIQSESSERDEAYKVSSSDLLDSGSGRD